MLINDRATSKLFYLLLIFEMLSSVTFNIYDHFYTRDNRKQLFLNIKIIFGCPKQRIYKAPKTTIAELKFNNIRCQSCLDD